MTVLPDYLIVARIGPLLRRIGLGFGLLSDDGLKNCERVGRGQQLEPHELDAGMDNAFVCWIVVGVLALLTAMGLTVLVGSLGAVSRLEGPVLLVPGLPLGLFAFAASCFGFVVVRSISLREAVILRRAGARATRILLPMATPKPRDSIFSLALGAIMVGLTLVWHA